ncbi:hypothetical protein [Streptomyces sp. CA-111067]|uniref:hypothetical protein n=1 Tax=Streptomyces sp. CA-111067 TaxID=3240046 RepID=UPI003D99FA66
MPLNPLAAIVAIVRLKTAGRALAALVDETDRTPAWYTANRRVEHAEADPNLPQRFLDPRDRDNAHTLHCRCLRARPGANGYCDGCGCHR